MIHSLIKALAVLVTAVLVAAALVVLLLLVFEATVTPFTPTR